MSDWNSIKVAPSACAIGVGWHETRNHRGNGNSEYESGMVNGTTVGFGEAQKYIEERMKQED